MATLPANVPANIRAFIELEQVLRDHHGEGALYVRPMLYERGPHLIVLGGWAFLDGEPAMIADGLTLMTITWEKPGAPTHTVGRDPAAILALLGDRVTKHSEPCPHYAVRVREADKPALLAQIEALPEHDPIPRAAPAPSAPATAAPPGDGIGAWILVGLMALVIAAIAAAVVFG